MNPSVSEQFRQRSGIADFPEHVDEVVESGEAPELLEVKLDREERERDAALQQAKVDAAEKFRDDEKPAEKDSKKAESKKTGK